MPQFHKKGPSKKSEYYVNVKDRPLEKPPELRNESLRYKALENKVFYFDFKNSSTAAWLEKEIRKLGGRVEYFFGKEVQYLITDKPQTRDTAPPCSPFSNPGPSPFSRPDTSQSMRDVGPAPSEWAYSDQWKKPQASSQRSRASKLMELASITKSQGSCDVFSRAKERGTTIKTVEQITSWLHTVHKKLGTKMSRDNLKETPKNPSRKLRGIYMKVEDTGHKYKPQVLDDATPWQTIDCTALADESPFGTEKRRITRKQALVKKTNQAKPMSIRGILKKDTTAAKKKSGKGQIRKRGGGKCEGCNVRFEKLETHLAADQHLKYAKKDKNFDAVDQLVSEGLSLDNFMLEQHNKVSLDSKSSSLKHVLSPQVKSDGSTEPLDVDGPCTRARKQKYQQDLISLTPLAPKEEAELVLAGPSPKVPGVHELENNYYLRSTPRKLVGMLDQWDSQWDTVLPDQVSQVSVVSDGTFLLCRSLDLYSSQGQITTPAVEPSPSDYAVKRPRIINSPTTSRLLDSPGRLTRQRSPAKARSLLDSPTRSQTPPPNTRSRSRSPNSPGTRPRNNSAVQAATCSPSTSAPLLNSPNKRSPRNNALPVKRRVINHS